jgi:hypothetical protein
LGEYYIFVWLTVREKGLRLDGSDAEGPRRRGGVAELQIENGWSMVDFGCLVVDNGVTSKRTPLVIRG